MFKQFILVQTHAGGSHDLPPDIPSIDWSLCVLCQETTSASLQQPKRGTRLDADVNYKINLDRIDGDNGIAKTLIANTASWHKSCRSRLSLSKIDRHGSAKKRTVDGSEAQQIGSPVKTRRLSNLSQGSDQSELTCFFCDGLDGDAGLYRASTHGLDKKCPTLCCSAERHLIDKKTCS